MVSESKCLNPLVALKRELANFLNFTINYDTLLETFYFSNYQLYTPFRPFHPNSMKLDNSDVLSQGMWEYGDGTQTVRQTTRGKLITFDPKFRTQF